MKIPSVNESSRKSDGTHPAPPEVVGIVEVDGIET